jgi:hypothetical protein
MKLLIQGVVKLEATIVGVFCCSHHYMEVL